MSILRLLLALLLLAPPVRAAAPPPPADPLALAGQPVLALAAHPAVVGTLRQATGGRQGAVARHLRLPGPSLRVIADRTIYGWACDAGAAGCGQDGIFLAYDATAGRIFLALVEGGAPIAWVPPRAAPWPAALEGPLRDFNPALAARLRFLSPPTPGP
jgi:hypothetical protein